MNEHNTLTRCPWCGEDPLYVAYHDKVWGRPVRDKFELLEKLILDGQQAGLSWITILKKKNSYHDAYDGFDPEKIAAYDNAKIEKLLNNPGIIRNRLKIKSVIQNSQAFLALENSGTDFTEYLWSFVGGAPIINSFKTMDDVPTLSKESEAMSKALKKAGFSFVGPTICYAFMEAVGMINDHLVDCFAYKECEVLQKNFKL